MTEEQERKNGEQEKEEELSSLERAVEEELRSSIIEWGRLQDGKLFLRVQPEKLKDVAKKLKEEEVFQMKSLHCVTAVDYPAEKEIEVVYHLYSMSKKNWIVLKTRLDREKPEVPSLCSVWGAADWLEREQYDLLGVLFTEHPDLRRILLPDYWPGFPLRKDWIEPDYKELTRLTIEGAFDT